MPAPQRPPTSLGGSAAHSVARPQVALQRLHHLAYVTRDTEATAEFYTGVLGLPLVNAVVDDHVPSTKEALPYIHSFFRLGTGETIAFFESPSLPPPAPKTHAVYRTFEHLALEVPSRENVDAWHEWLVAGDYGLDHCKLERKRDQCSRRSRRMDQDQTRGSGRRQRRHRGPMRARRRAQPVRQLKRALMSRFGSNASIS